MQLFRPPLRFVTLLHESRYDAAPQQGLQWRLHYDPDKYQHLPKCAGSMRLSREWWIGLGLQKRWFWLRRPVWRQSLPHLVPAIVATTVPARLEPEHP